LARTCIDLTNNENNFVHDDDDDDEVLVVRSFVRFLKKRAQPLTMDTLARRSKKNAAKCDNSGEMRTAWLFETLNANRALCHFFGGRVRSSVLYESSSGPRIGQDHPLNLSILISGGKETNRDALSNGEWSGQSSSLKSAFPRGASNCSFRSADRAPTQAVGIRLERRAVEGESPVRQFVDATFRHPRVGLFEIAALTRVVDPIQS